ncbi:hypothetical protein [Actinoallomurus sp. CA-142502]|uniref:hypothetical protein n=1 Tax=Actinoallomurus sp. CA-142502 TaxID=3239885 RepID=UPI003D932500
MERMLTGVLVAESPREGGVLSGVPLQVRRIERGPAPEPESGQSLRWTILEFAAPEDDAGRLAEALAACLEPAGGWYADFNTAAEAFVVFPGRVFRYPRGDGARRAEVAAYARSVGVPEPQLDRVD